MNAYHFISYSSADAQDFAYQLHDALCGGSPPISAWLDKRDLKAGLDWDEQLLEAIRACRCLLFVMTRDSVEAHSVCKNEWSRALGYKKPVVPLRLHPEAELPFRLGSRHYIDFSGDFKTGLARLREHLAWLDSPEGKRQELENLLAEAQRDQHRAATTAELARIQADMAFLQQQIAAQKELIQNPQAVAQRVEASIRAGLERERQPEKPVSGRRRSKFINPPPATAPPYFQDRYLETQLIRDFLQDEGQRLLTVVGRGGVGKTALVCRLLKALENGRLPDDLGELPLDGIVYLSATGTRQVNLPNLYADLSRLLPPAAAAELEAVYKNPQADAAAKMRALLAAFPPPGIEPVGRVVVLLDNFESVVDPDSRTIADAELAEALRAGLELPPHAVKIILTTRLAPRDLALVHPERQWTLTLDEGLDSPHAENILREMDAGGRLGLRDAPAGLLAKAKERTRGYPRALEALFAILSADRHTTLEELLQADLPENVIEALVGEAYNRLDPAAQQVMQALAVYGRPVTPTAVDYLLQPHLPGLDSAPLLNRLVNMHFVRKEEGRYYLHPVDSAYALHRVPRSEETDQTKSVTLSKSGFLAKDPDSSKMSIPPYPLLPTPYPLLPTPYSLLPTPYSLLALYRRGADYFRQTRQPRAAWKTIADLAPQLAEFHLRYAAGDYDTAAGVLLEIDFDYLLLWGHYRLMIELHEQLQGKLNDVMLKEFSVGKLGSAYAMIGQTRKAITCQEQALAITRERKDLGNEGVWLGNLGNRYADLGQTARAIEFYEQALAIAREIGNRQGEGNHLGNLGNRYAGLGQTARAIEFYEQALAIAREIGDRAEEGRHLGNLGLCYANLGQTARAIEFYEQALAIDREVGYRQGEGIHLGNLGSRYAGLGQTACAIEFYEQALAIAREIGDRRGEGSRLGNLGLCYAGLGQTARAIEFYEQALAIAREIGDRNGESFNLNNLGDVLVDQGDWDQAKQKYNQALQIADEISLVTIQNYARWGLALAHLYAGDLPAARPAVEAARQYDVPQNNHNVLALLGLVALRQGERAAALEAFTAAVAQADQLLAQTPQLYEALDAKGLALCGLSVMRWNVGTLNVETSNVGTSNVETLNVELENAITAYRAARAINRDAGVVRRVVRLLEALAGVDSTGVVARVRAAAVGEEG